MKSLVELRADALGIFNAALAAADPAAAVLRSLDRRDNSLVVGAEHFELGKGRVIVVGAGKAGAPMARAVEQVLGDRISRGTVTVKYGHTGPATRINLYEAGHPLPDENGVRATGRLISLLRGLQPDDLVLCLISGGGSALLELPVPGVTLDDLRTLTGALLRSGATIDEINALRKHLSQVKGGQLARLAQPAAVLSLILSDVLVQQRDANGNSVIPYAPSEPGDPRPATPPFHAPGPDGLPSRTGARSGPPLDVIASGPTAPDSSTFVDALGVIEKYGLRDQLPASILKHIGRGARGEIPETPKPGDPLFNRVLNVVVADNQSACRAAAAEARSRGYETTLLSTTVQGEAREVGAELGRRAAELAVQGLEQPRCLLAGGEPTVTIRGSGKGGRSQELALAAAPEIAGVDRVVVLSAGTDGTDGPTDAAGAIADSTTVSRANERGLEPGAYLANNDSYHFFKALGDLVITGPTNTNVNDLMVVLTSPLDERG